MRIANVGGRLSLVRGDELVDVEHASEGRFTADPQGVFEEWVEFRRWAETQGQMGAAPTADSVPTSDGDRGTPVPRPSQVFAVGLNYQAHADESGNSRPTSPMIFTKYQTCLTGPFSSICLPSDKVDWEVEVVVAIGRRARRVKRHDAWSHVAGLMVGQDLSERELQSRPPKPQFSLAKSFPGFGPVGPVLVTPDEFDDPDDLELSCILNGEVVQRARTSDMIFGISELIESLSTILPLLPGDLIFTGTPSGIGSARSPQRFLAPGDVLESSVEGVGTIVNRLVACQ